MATDYSKLAANLRSFYDFNAKAVLFVGAGGGQPLDAAVKPTKMIAIDPDRDALATLEKGAADNGMRGLIELSVCVS